jgi:hypothetical protein
MQIGMFWTSCKNRRHKNSEEKASQEEAEKEANLDGGGWMMMNQN